MKSDHETRRTFWHLILIGCGIYVAPYVFAWFTLREGYPRWYRILSFVYGGLLIAGVSAMILYGGDRWPVSVDNRTANPVQIVYKHRDYESWSVPFDILPDRAINLSRSHFLKDVQGLRISEGGKWYIISPASLAKMHNACAGNVDCNLTYWGHGKIETTLEPTRKLDYTD